MLKFAIVAFRPRLLPRIGGMMRNSDKTAGYILGLLPYIGALLVVTVIGCMSPRAARLYDIQGGAILTATFKGTGNAGAKGTMRVVLPSGEVCNGEYATTSQGSASWGQIYFTGGGSGTFVGGSRSNEWFGTAVAVGNRGTVFSCEFLAMPLGPAHGYCVDNQKRPYRLMFD